ncbi:hypothetical protein [Thalassomonas sp. RHCl1]|uniref:hypothetical protein n=1 Tax=Thalassomonas sp. RHCl1 TaxID=2995320 RepID=UPI00248CC5CA|nr:hypothetical protein [Thalassomonas sp. RHCl1]
MKKILSPLMLAGICLSLSSQASANEQACNATVQLTHYSPGICYLDYDQASCTDTCASADPQFQQSCFAEISLPCSLKNDLYSTASGYQQRDSYSWVHISDLLSFPALRSDLHIIQQDMYQTLYEDYLIFPVNDVFSEASIQLKKENFRLDMLGDSKTVTTPLNEAGLFRRLSLGLALQDDMNQELTNIHNKVALFPLYNSTEKATLSSEINSLKNSQLLYWNYVSRYPTASVASSRISYLNTKISQFVSGLNELSGDKFTTMMAKSALLATNYDINLRLCQPEGQSACYDPIVNSDPASFYQGTDQSLTYFEETLSLLAKEVEAMKLSFDPELNPGTPGSFSAPDFSGFINDKLTAYIDNPGQEALVKLESAINVAFLQLGNSGLELFDELKASTASHIQGNAFLAPVDNKNPLLCNDYVNLDPQIEAIRTEIFDKSNEARDVIKLMGEQGHSQELLDRLNALIARITELTAQSQRIFSVDRFSDDRQINVLWRLDGLPQAFSTDNDQLTVEFVAIDGMFWMPSMSIQLQQLLPSIESLATMKGSLLPSGDGRISGMRSLNLTLRQSPYTSCSAANSEIKMVVAVTDDSDTKTRHVLTAELNQL